MRRAFTGVGALLLIGLILIGVPAVLVAFFGNPLPNGDELAAIARLQPDWGNRTLLGVVLPCATWIAWALFAIPLLAEIFSRVTGRPFRSARPALGTQTRFASALVAAALFTAITPTIATASSAAQTRPTFATVARSATDSAGQHADDNRAASANTHREQRYRVKSGDTLWAVADRFLGSGTKYPTIATASANIHQTDGRQLTDPNLILPGWRLDIPTTPHATTPAQPATPPAPSQHLGQANLATPSASASSRSVVDEPQPQPAQSTPGAEHISAARVPTSAAAAGGVAALLAAALLVALRIRRRRQRSIRSFGERIALPAPEVQEVEQQLAAAQDITALDDLNSALAQIQVWAEATSSALPELFAVRVDDDRITAFLAHPAELPAPFQSAYGDNTAWAAPRMATRPPSQSGVAPYPALVTIGTDQDGGLLLLDLEQLGVLTITAHEDDLARAALNAIAAELASVPWANDIHLSLVGVPSDLPFTLDPYRLHRVTDTTQLVRDLRTHLADRQQTLHGSQATNIRQARVLANQSEAWAPFVALIATDCTPTEQQELLHLAEQYGPAGLVLVQIRPESTTGTSIELRSTTTASYQTARTDQPALPFVPQLLTDHALNAVLELFATTDETATPAPAYVPAPARITTEEEDPAPSAAALPADGDDAPEVVERLVDAAPAEQLLARQPSPYIRLLGPVDALDVTGPVPLPGRGLEFLAYLLTHQQPIAGAQIQKALWPNTYDRSNNNTRTLAKQVRSALGHDPDGHLWLPEGRGGNGFTLHPSIRTDWHDFTALTGADPRQATDEDLEAALRLVRGQPLIGTEAHRGRWAWRAPLEEAIIAAVLDTAEVLAERALQTRDRRLIRITAQTARTIEPLSELSWQIELKAAVAESADADDIERIINDLFATAGGGDPDFEPDATTTELIERGRRSVLQSEHG